MECIVQADINEWDELADSIMELLRSRNFNNKDIISFIVALEEIFVNIANYAYEPDTGTVEVKINITDNTVAVQFCDSGKPFDPSEIELPDIDATSKQRKIGGLGIYMARVRSDNMIYEYHDNKNKLTLIKKFT